MEPGIFFSFAAAYVKGASVFSAWLGIDLVCHEPRLKQNSAVGQYLFSALPAQSGYKEKHKSFRYFRVSVNRLLTHFASSAILTQ